MITRRRSYSAFVLITRKPDQNEVIVPSDDYGYGCPGYASDNKTLATTFSLVMLTPYNNTLVSLFTSKSHLLTRNTHKKTLVSLLTPESHWVTSDPLTRKFRIKLNK
ncbi:hypothetical protein Hanom_Chr12g01126871 [Helianthus anomalus]